jgi:hypothetical protein
MAQRPVHPHWIEPEQLSRRGRRAKDAAGRGDVRAAPVVMRHQRVADPA